MLRLTWAALAVISCAEAEDAPVASPSAVLEEYARLPPPPPVVETVPVVIKGVASERISHAKARQILRVPASVILGRDPSLAELQGIQAVALHETWYGRGWKGNGIGSNNWAAAHGPCSGPSFSHRDQHPGGRGYDACFRAYPPPEAGAAHLVRIILRSEGARQALDTGRLDPFAAALYDARFYEGHHADRDAAILSYVGALDHAVGRIADVLDEEAALW